MCKAPCHTWGRCGVTQVLCKGRARAQVCKSRDRPGGPRTRGLVKCPRGVALRQGAWFRQNSAEGRGLALVQSTWLP